MIPRAWGALVSVAALALACAAVALAGGAAPISANLDADPYTERVVPEEVCEATDGTLHPPQPECAEDQLSRRRVVIEDVCAGQPYVRRISNVQDFVQRLRVVEADGRTSRPEIFLDVRSGATGRGGEMRVVRYGGNGGACPKADVLFRYPTRSTLGRIPRGAVGRDSFSAVLGDYVKRYRGREIKLAETYVDRNDPFCCPSFGRTTYFRFRGERYRRYRTRVTRIRARP